MEGKPTEKLQETEDPFDSRYWVMVYNRLRFAGERVDWTNDLDKARERLKSLDGHGYVFDTETARSI